MDDNASAHPADSHGAARNPNTDSFVPINPLGAAGVIVAPTLAHAAAAAGISIVFLVAAPPATSVPYNLAHLDDSGKPNEGRAASSPVLEARKPRSAATHSRSLSQRPKIV
jgi:hypothetical protein